MSAVSAEKVIKELGFLLDDIEGGAPAGPFSPEFPLHTAFSHTPAPGRVASQSALFHLALLAEDLACIFTKHPGKRRFPLLYHYARIKFKQKIFQWFHVRAQKESFLGLTMHFPEYAGFSHLFREIFVRENYFFETDSPAPQILDAGSNIGMSICYFKYLHPRAAVTGFEPDPQAFAWLKKNIEANRFENVVVYNVALGAEKGKATFWESAEEAASGRNSMKEAALGEQKGVPLQVSVERLSHYIGGKVDLLKVDVEGAEYDIFREIDRAQKFHLVNKISAEVHQFAGTKNEPIPDFFALLEKNGFRYAVTETFKGHYAFEENPREAYAIMVDAERSADL
jgi:FkbM family methyltransferase